MTRKRRRGTKRTSRPPRFPRPTRAFGKAARERGEQSERRFFEAFEGDDFTTPSWFKGVGKSSKEQDHRGIDAIVETDIGKIFVQIKSSISGVKKFLKSQKEDKVNQHIVVVVVRPVRDSDREIRRKTFRIVGEKRKYFLNLRRQD